MKQIRDPRKRPDLCTYPIEYILMTVLLMHCGQCGSRRRLGRELVGGRLGGNIWRLVGKAYSDVVCHTDTLNGVMEILGPEQIEGLIAAVFSQLRKCRALDRFRFDGKLTGAVDGTQVFSLKKPHCKRCTHQTQSGITTYFHCVLAVKIVTPMGLVVPLAFEFIENPGKEYDKQDCELKAWRRLFEKIRRLYPRLRLNLVGDGLFADETTFRDCEEAGWNYAITLSEDKLPTVTAQLPPNVADWSGSGTMWVPDQKHGRVKRIVRWKTPVRYHGEIVHVIEMEDLNEQGERVYYNRWISNLKPDRDNAFGLAQTGRLRWKIENEGTNTQKNGGYEMKHVYGRKEKAWKNYYLTLQVSQLLNDLVRFGDCIRKLTGDPKASFATVYEAMKTFARRLIEHLRYGLPDLDGPLTSRPFQIRLSRL